MTWQNNMLYIISMYAVARCNYSQLCVTDDLSVAFLRPSVNTAPEKCVRASAYRIWQRAEHFASNISF